MQMSAARWEYTRNYLAEVFGQQDAELEALKIESRAAGLPEIAVSADVGHLLSILVAGTAAQRAIEVGTLGGYSAVWLARALRDDGRLITIEREEAYADFAETQFAKLGLAGKVEVRRGSAIDVLATLREELGADSVDVVFIDALKSEYPDYWREVRSMIRPGGLLIADNALGTSDWWIDDTLHPERQGADSLNRSLAQDPAFEAVAVPLREGLLIARRKKLT